MHKIRFSLLLLLLPSLWLNAKSLQLDDEYAVFGGQPVNLKQVVGQKPVYIKFWATWCMDCRRELPGLQKIYETYRDKIGVYAVNLNINEKDEYILALQKEHKLTIPIVMDNKGSIAGNFQFYGTPFHVLINAQGKVVYSTYKDDEVLQQQLLRLANQENVKTNAETAAVPLTNITSLPAGTSLIYFSATWCDWYMKDIHPEMATNCINSTHLMNQLSKKKAGTSLQAYVTHLWTEPKDLQEYVTRFSVDYPVSIDKDNQIARHYQVSEYPTLIVFKDQQELKRYIRFDGSDTVLNEVSTLMHSK
jgi:thiol-disulfide isomerase/thioredoxin